MKLTNEQKDILICMIQHELDFYENKEDTYPEDVAHIKELYKILRKLGGE